MLDFDFNFRWFRTLYIVVLAAFIFFVAGWLPAAICLLAVVDITFDKNVFENAENDGGQLNIVSGTNPDSEYGPDS